MERTFLMVKPDGVQRNLVGEIVARFEKKGFQLVGGKLMSISRDLAEEHYGEHKERPFFGELVDFITSGPVFAMVWEGENVISTARQMMGSTNPKDAAPGTIRGDEHRPPAQVPRSGVRKGDASYDCGCVCRQLQDRSRPF